MDGERPGHTIGQSSVMQGMTRNLLHSNSISTAPNLNARGRSGSVRGLIQQPAPRPPPFMLYFEGVLECCMWARTPAPADVCIAGRVSNTGYRSPDSQFHAVLQVRMAPGTPPPAPAANGKL